MLVSCCMLEDVLMYIRRKGKKEVVEVDLTVHIAKILDDAQFVISGCFVEG